MASMQAKLDAIEDVVIDDKGRFKYVLINLHAEPLIEKLVVRGNNEAEFHADVYDEFMERTMALGLDSECLGGGRIHHDPVNKKIEVYGYSMGYGRADHSKVVELLKKKYPGYTDINWTNEGY